MVKRISGTKLSHLTIYTNNLLVIEDWRQRIHMPRIRETKVRLIGWELDISHMAFYGTEDAKKKIMDPDFRPSVVFIGTSGIEFDDKGLLFGYHADEAERSFKQLLFQCNTKVRVILATPGKIGYAGGLVFSILDLPGLHKQAPLYLVTVAPTSSNKTQTGRQFQEAEARFKEAVEGRIKESGLMFSWVILDPETGKKSREYLVNMTGHENSDDLVETQVRVQKPVHVKKPRELVA